MTKEWRVDSLGENTAAVEEEGQLVHVPRWLLPDDVQENDVVRITLTGDGDERHAVFHVDRAATDAALAASRRQVAATPPQNDPGGPIQL